MAKIVLQNDTNATHCFHLGAYKLNAQGMPKHEGKKIVVVPGENAIELDDFNYLKDTKDKEGKLRYPRMQFLLDKAKGFRTKDYAEPKAKRGRKPKHAEGVDASEATE